MGILLCIAGVTYGLDYPMDNQMENKMENEMEYYGDITTTKTFSLNSNREP